MATANKSLSSLLKTAKKNWGETVTNAKATNFTEFPDGKYIMLLSAVDIRESTTANPTWGALHSWIVQEGDLQGQTHTEWLNLFDEEGNLTSFAVRRMEAFSGTDAEELDPSMLEEIFADAVEEGQVWSAQLKTTISKANGNSYQNLRLGKRLEDYEPIAAAEEEDEALAKSKTPKTTAAAKTSAMAKAVAKEPAAVTASKAKAKPAPVVEEEEDDEDGGKTSEFEVGDEVEWTVTTGKGKAAKTETFSGTVHSIDEDEGTAEIKTGGTAKKPVLETVELDELSLVADEEADEEEAEESEPSYEVGQEVTFSVTSGKGRAKTTVEHTGKVASVDEEAETVEVKVGIGRKAETHTVAFADILANEEEEDDETTESEDEDNDAEDATLEVGQEVTIEVDGKEVTGKITSIDEDASELDVKVGRKTHTVGFDAVVTESDEEEDDEDSEEEEDDEEEGEDSLEVGMSIEFQDPKSKKTLQGKIVSFDDKSETAKAKVGAIVKTVPYGDIVILKQA